MFCLLASRNVFYGLLLIICELFCPRLLYLLVFTTVRRVFRDWLYVSDVRAVYLEILKTRRL